MKKSLLLLLAAFATLAASAQTKVEIEGIWYNLVSKVKQAEVTYKGDSYNSYDDEYSGTITLPATVTYEGVNYSVTSIGDYAFYYCRSLTSITIPESVTSIGGSAFLSCSSLTTITIPESVTSIGGAAFYSCSSLTAITLPKSVTSIGNNTFYYCRSLTAITIPEGVTSIGERAFRDCSSLKSITLPEGVTSIGERAFEGCSRLTAITIPESVTSIGERAFEGCTSLTAIILPEGVTSIGWAAFRSCRSLTDINIPEGVTSIGSETFAYCSSLTAITIPEGVTSIVEGAFSDCSSLTTIVLPKNLKDIDSQAFANCAELLDVYCYAESVPSTKANAFEDSYPEYATLHVPADALNAYKSTEPWSSFGTILPLDGDQPAEEGWSEWEALGTAVTASGKETMIQNLQYWGAESNVGWDEPITIDQRTSVVDPTKHQLRLNDIFNSKDIILDYDSSTSEITAERQATGYATNKELLEEQTSWPDFYDEFMFALDLKKGSYNPLTGVIDLSNAFFHTSGSHLFYFNLGFTLQIENVAEEGWSAWTNLGTAVMTSGKETVISTVQYWGYDTNVGWDDPITIDQRTSVVDPTKHQLRLNDIFNNKDIILDYDSSTSEITAQTQSTGYAIDKDKLQGYEGLFDEFAFYIGSNASGTYNPVIGTINMPNAWLLLDNSLGFKLDLILQMEGVTPPTFDWAWDRAYVGREGGEATLAVTFEEPIVKYRKLVVGPGETVYTSQVKELCKANPVTDLQYEDTDQPITTITCDKMGTYRVVLIPLGADGAALMDYTVAKMNSYAEPDYGSYTWNYIGESTVIEAMGSNLIPNEVQWEEVDDTYVNKYPWQATVEGVQTYRRADNPNIIGLRNLYGKNHPYSSMFQFIDQSQDWWVYIDVTNPEDVKLLTTPVGAISSQVGYGSFINQEYADANAAATYADGVITFPYLSVMLGNILNQEQGAEFDFKVILPEEVSVPMATIAINQYGSGTYCSPYALDFSAVEGLKAYAATGYNKKTKVVTLTRVMTTQPGEGLFIKGESGTYMVPIIEEADDNSLNMLVGALTETAVNATSGDGLYANYKYTVAEGETEPLFHRFMDGSTLIAGKAYLQIPIAWLPTNAARSIGLRFDEGTTSIENIEPTANSQQPTAIYDLQGRRVAQPVKGVYIINGKKVVL